MEHVGRHPSRDDCLCPLFAGCSHSEPRDSDEEEGEELGVRDPRLPLPNGRLLLDDSEDAPSAEEAKEEGEEEEEACEGEEGVGGDEAGVGDG